jgi:hypothetical protein
VADEDEVAEILIFDQLRALAPALTVRLFRQKNHRHGTSVITEVAEALNALSGERRRKVKPRTNRYSMASNLQRTRKA